MKLVKKIIRIGHSDGIILDKTILNKLNIKRGDYIEIIFNKVEE